MGKELVSFSSKRDLISNSPYYIKVKNLTQIGKVFNYEENIKQKMSYNQLKMKYESNNKKLANFRKIFDLRPQFSDVKLIIGNKYIWAHKLILSAASPIFFDMFSVDNGSSLAEIMMDDKITFEAMEILVNFCYTYEIREMNLQEALDVFEIAERFEIPDLKGASEKVLITKIDQNCMVNLLTLAEQYSAEKLKQRILKYIDVNRESIDYNKFEILLKSDSPNLVLDIMKKLAQPQIIVE